MMSSLNSQNRRGLKDTYKKIIEYVSNYRPELGQQNVPTKKSKGQLISE